MTHLDSNEAYDVIVVGGGNAALCAALAAEDGGARVLLLERAPVTERGGNSAYTDGLMRFVYEGAEDIRALCPDVTDAEAEASDFGSYTEENFFDDMGRITQYRTDPDLCEILVKQSKETLFWMKSKGVRFLPYFGRQAFRVDGRFKFWGGATVAVASGGQGLIESLYGAAAKNGIDVVYEAWVQKLMREHGRVAGVVARIGGDMKELRARAVILACGGFEANTEWRTRYLGPGWDLAKVRGTRFNTGDGLAMALEMGAMAWGNWSGCHAVAWERNASDFGDPDLTQHFQRNSYQLGIVVNSEGQRFIDEGADFRNYTYAKYGRAVLAQPGQAAWQIFDGKVLQHLRDEYRSRYVTRFRSDTLEGLIEQLDEVDKPALRKTIQDYNAAVLTDIPFNPNIKDGRGAPGLPVPRTHWANPLDTPPFEAYAVTCGVTFTFGGIRINTSGQVLDSGQQEMPGLFAAGEMVGGIFYHNYPGASGLTSGAVFGRLAGGSAARSAVAARAGSAAVRKTA